ncbi:hypothetical protein LCGC14_1187720 [marine sediment metagenome]|uniref:Peptidase M15C domain-containing protein n=1 Tax=marine sediment metagenome TaxID=412755 RepID=A0A0F9PQS4_9ZZZZ
MPSFGQASKGHLLTCDERLQRVAREVVKNYDCSVWEGHRGEEDQTRYFRHGKSRVRWPNSKHNVRPSKAMHLLPHPFPGWENSKTFYFFGGYVVRTAEVLGIKLRWGGDWDSDYDLDDQKFMDLMHFELAE